MKMPSTPRFASVLAAVAALAIVPAAPVSATILTFEDFTANNANVSAVANPFGAGQYASRAASAVNAGFLAGDGFTPGVTVAWGAGCQTYTGWPFGDNATTGAGRVAQIDFDASAQQPVDITFTPDAGLGVVLKGFAFTVWNGSPTVPVQIRWTVYGGSAAAGNVLATGTSNALGTAGGAQVISTGLTQPHSSATPVMLRWERLSGDGTYIAINNLEFNQGSARTMPVITWTKPDAIVAGTALSGTQLNAVADAAGTFTYNPPAGTVPAAGTHSLQVTFVPDDTATYSNASASTTLLVKETNIPTVTSNPLPRIAAGTALSAATFSVTADVLGAFTVSPPAGTVLALGSHYITATFTPANPVFSTVQIPWSLVVETTLPEGTVWRFDDAANRLRVWSGDDILTYYDPSATGWAASKIDFGKASSFGLPLPAGGDPDVMHFANTLSSEGLRLTCNDPPNGNFVDNGWTSNYTLIFDVLYPSGGVTRPLYNANITNANAAEASVNAADAVQVSSLAYGAVTPGTWHRVALVVRSANAEGQVHVYVDGTFTGSIGSNDTIVSAGFALEEAVLLLTSSTGNGGPGYLSGLRFVGRCLNYAEVNGLGGVHAGGPHVPGPAAPPAPFQPHRDVLIIGHRGNGGFMPEDTLPSFLGAFALGADVVEIDIRLTADNRVVAMHDSTINRTTNGTGNASAFTLAQIQTYDAGSWFDPAFAGTPPPSLREIMAAVRDTYPNAVLYLDCKITGLAPRIKADMDATGFPVERLWFWNYNNATETAAVRSVFPTSKSIWGETNWHNGASISTWPSLTAAQKQAVVDGMKARGVHGFDFGDNEMDSLNPTTLQELRAAGFLVSAYSALHPASMHRAIENLGLDAMETDFPGVLRELMPLYASTATATALSSGAVQVDFSAFPSPPVGSEIRVRRKAKASPPATWTEVTPAQPSAAQQVIAGSLAAATLYEFQPILWQGGQPIAFGSVTDATTLAGDQNFATAYAAWQTAHPGTGAPGEDSDGDGLTNLMEFATGRTPTASDGHSPMEITGPMTLLYRRQTGTFVRWHVESSSDLTGWTPLLPLTEWQESTLSAGPGHEINQVTVPLAPGTPRRFLRMSVTPLP